VDQLAHLIHQVAAPDMNFFNQTLELHNLNYVGVQRQVPKHFAYAYKSRITFPFPSFVT